MQSRVEVFNLEVICSFASLPRGLRNIELLGNRRNLPIRGQAEKISFTEARRTRPETGNTGHHS